MEDLRKARSWLQTVAAAMSLLKWSLPPTEKLRLVVDVARMQANHHFGVRCVIRDDTGTMMVATALSLAESINVLHDELMVLRFGL